jgi:hypothetical protein
MAIEANQELLRRTVDEPPQYLVEMRRVYNCIEPSTASQRWLKLLKDTKPLEFLRELRQAEREYRGEQRVNDTEPSAARGNKEEEADEGLARSLELAREWLENRPTARMRSAQ